MDVGFEHSRLVEGRSSRGSVGRECEEELEKHEEELQVEHVCVYVDLGLAFQGTRESIVSAAANERERQIVVAKLTVRSERRNEELDERETTKEEILDPCVGPV
jgi:hypothetical protein